MAIEMEKLREIIEINSRAAFARAWIRIIGLAREPSWMIFEIILPLLFVCAYVYLYKALGSPQAFLGFAILGGTMIGFWMSILWGMASQLYWERERGQLELMLIAPFSRVSLLLGMALGGMVSTIFRSAFTFTFGILIFKIPLTISSPWALLSAFIFTMFALYGLGMIGSSLYLMCGRNVFHLSSLFQEPVFLLSGFYFPVRSLGVALASIASIIPVTLGLDAMRQLIFAGGKYGFLSPGIEIVLLLIQGIVYFIIACKALQYVETLARREGRLTLRWQ